MTTENRQRAKLTAALAAAAYIGLELPSPQGAAEMPRRERWITAVCRRCEAACGFFVGTVDRRICAVRFRQPGQNGQQACLAGLEAMLRDRSNVAPEQG